MRALQKASPEFAELWERHEVARRFEDRYEKLQLLAVLGQEHFAGAGRG